VLYFGLPDALERTLATTNPIENVNSTARRASRNVKRWQDGSMVLRWMAAAIGEAEKGFRRLRGHQGMPQLLKALRAHDEKRDGGVAPAKEAA
jgi:transposase-like protein